LKIIKEPEKQMITTKKNALIMGSIFIIVCFFSTRVYAYIGPGLGVGAIATILGIFLGLLMLLIGIIWYPIKKLLKTLKK